MGLVGHSRVAADKKTCSAEETRLQNDEGPDFAVRKQQVLRFAQDDNLRTGY
jgi:hypothetical protein